MGHCPSNEAWLGKAVESGHEVVLASAEYLILPPYPASSRHDHVPPIPIGHQRMSASRVGGSQQAFAGSRFGYQRAQLCMSKTTLRGGAPSGAVSASTAST